MELFGEGSAEDLYELLGGLPEIDEMMTPFEGTNEERHALAGYLERLASGHEPTEEGN